MIGIVLVLLMILRNLNTGEISPMFSATATPTRTLASFAEEGETYFIAGDLEKAIEAYKQAVALDPANALHSLNDLTGSAERRCLSAMLV